MANTQQADAGMTQDLDIPVNSTIPDGWTSAGLGDDVQNQPYSKVLDSGMVVVVSSLTTVTVIFGVHSTRNFCSSASSTLSRCFSLSKTWVLRVWLVRQPPVKLHF